MRFEAGLRQIVCKNLSPKKKKKPITHTHKKKKKERKREGSRIGP
jgi:hypothetical protein